MPHRSGNVQQIVRRLGCDFERGILKPKDYSCPDLSDQVPSVAHTHTRELIQGARESSKLRGMNLDAV